MIEISDKETFDSLEDWEMVTINYTVDGKIVLKQTMTKRQAVLIMKQIEKVMKELSE